MVKTKVIGPLKLDMDGAKKIGKSFLLTIGSAGIVALSDLLGIVDFGTLTPYATIAVPFILNVLRKFIGKYESK